MADGITFNIGCTKYDIHDNDVVNIYKGKAPETKPHVVPECDAQEIVTTDAQEAAEENAQEATEEASSDDTSDRSLPDCLSTPEAMLIWRRLQKAGMVDERWQPVGMNKSQTMYMADCMADRLHLRYRWSPFEKLWKVTRLADAKYDMQRTGEMPFRSKEIEELILR